MHQYGPRFDYTPYEQSFITGAYFIGNALSAVPVSILVGRFDCVRSYIFCSCLLTGLLVGLTPAVAANMSLLIAVRVAIGLLQAPLYPAMHKLFDQWAPPDELGKFNGSLMGSSFGTIISWTISGVLIENFGWPYSFYGAATLTLAFCAGWWLVVYNSPAEHPRIATEEREYIEMSLVDSKVTKVSCSG